MGSPIETETKREPQEYVPTLARVYDRLLAARQYSDSAKTLASDYMPEGAKRKRMMESLTRVKDEIEERMSDLAPLLNAGIDVDDSDRIADIPLGFENPVADDPFASLAKTPPETAEYSDIALRILSLARDDVRVRDALLFEVGDTSTGAYQKWTFIDILSEIKEIRVVSIALDALRSVREVDLFLVGCASVISDFEIERAKWPELSALLVSRINSVALTQLSPDAVRGTSRLFLRECIASLASFGDASVIGDLMRFLSPEWDELFLFRVVETIRRLLVRDPETVPRNILDRVYNTCFRSLRAFCNPHVIAAAGNFAYCVAYLSLLVARLESEMVEACQMVSDCGQRSLIDAAKSCVADAQEDLGRRKKEEWLEATAENTRKALSILG